MAAPRYSSRPAPTSQGQQPEDIEHEVLVVGGQEDRHKADTARDRLIAHVTPELVSAVRDLFPQPHYSPVDDYAFIQYHEGQQRVVRTLLEAVHQKRA